MFTSKFLFNREFYKKTESFLLFSILCLLIIAFSHDVTDMGTLWGQFGRANGIGLYLLVLIYLYFGSRETVKVFFRSISIVLVFEIVYGFIQLAKLDFFDWNNPYGDIFITTGNPNFASSLVGILTLLNTRNFYFSKNNFERVSHLILFLLGTFITLQTNSLQGLLIIGFGLAIILFVLLVRSKLLLGVKLSLSIPILMISLFVVAGIFKIGPLKELLFQETLNVRLHYWRVAIRIIQDHPLLGVGIDSYGEYFRLYRESTFVDKYGVGLISNNAHNVLLQWGTEFGYLGSFLYFMLIVIAIRKYFATRPLSSSGQLRDIDFLFIGFFLFYLQSLISISQLSITVLGFAILGNLLKLSRLENPNIESSKKTQVKPKTNRIQSKTQYVGIGTWWLFLSTFLALIFSNPVRKDLDLLKSISLPGASQQVQDLSVRSQAIRKAVQPFITDDDYLNFAIQNLFREGKVDEGVQLALEAIDLNPNSWVAYQSLVLAYSQSGQTSEALKYALKSLELDPLNYNIMFNVGREAFREGQFGVASKYNQRVLAAAPADSEAYKNARLLQQDLRKQGW
jgi:O-antigen ligase